MSTIHSITSQGSGTILGPVSVKKSFPMKQGDKSSYVVVTDSTGESALKIWNPTGSSANLQEGQIITMIGQGPRGSIVNKEYPPGSGKWALNASDCRCDVQGAAVVQNAPQTPYVPPASTNTDAHLQSNYEKVKATSKQAALWTASYVDELVVNGGFTRDEALMLAQGAHNGFPIWWFGEKGI